MTVKTVSLAVVCVVSAASAIAQITVGPNVQISKRRQARAVRIDAGAHPTDPQRLVAYVVLFVPTRPAQTSAVYLSKDGGNRWRVALQPDDIQRTGDRCAHSHRMADNDKHMIIRRAAKMIRELRPRTGVASPW